MSARALLLLFLLLLAVLAYVIWVDEPMEEAEDGDLGPVLPREIEAVAAIELGRGEATCRLEKASGGGWRLESPSQAEADPRKVRSLLQAVKDARVRQVVAEAAGDSEPFGLRSPESVLRLFFEGGGDPFVLRLGRISPVGSERYGSVGDGRVLLIDGSVAFAVDRDPDHFRERRFLPLEAERVRRIVVGAGAGRVVLEREGTRWQMLAPVEDRADFGKCDALARRLATLSAETLFDPAEPGPTGFSPRLSVEVSDGRRALRLEIGGRAGPETVYARRAGPGPPLSGTLSGRQAAELEQRPDAYRDPRLVYLSRSDVLEVRLVREASTLILSREREGEPWIGRVDGEPARSADPAKMDELLDHIRWVRAMTFGPRGDPAEELPTEIVLGGDAGELGRLRIGRAPKEARQGEVVLPARSSWRPGFRFGISGDLLDVLPDGLDDVGSGRAVEAS